MNAASALFTKTQQAVLNSIFQAPPEGVTFADVVRAAGGGFGGTQKVLKTLESAGLVSSRRFGNQKRYSPNWQHPIANDLQSIVEKTIGFVPTLRIALAPLSDKIELAFVFGSVARSGERAESDIDLGIIGSVSRRALALPIHEVEIKLGRQINTMLADSESRFLDLFQYPSRRALEEAIGRGEMLLIADNTNAKTSLERTSAASSGAR